MPVTVIWKDTSVAWMLSTALKKVAAGGWKRFVVFNTQHRTAPTCPIATSEKQRAKEKRFALCLCALRHVIHVKLSSNQSRGPQLSRALYQHVSIGSVVDDHPHDPGPRSAFRRIRGRRRADRDRVCLWQVRRDDYRRRGPRSHGNESRARGRAAGRRYSFFAGGRGSRVHRYLAAGLSDGRDG